MPDYNCFDVFKGGHTAKDLQNYPHYLASVFGL
jgi:modulator of drug activity B